MDPQHSSNATNKVVALLAVLVVVAILFAVVQIGSDNSPSNNRVSHSNQSEGISPVDRIVITIPEYDVNIDIKEVSLGKNVEEKSESELAGNVKVFLTQAWASVFGGYVIPVQISTNYGTPILLVYFEYSEPGVLQSNGFTTLSDNASDVTLLGVENESEPQTVAFESISDDPQENIAYAMKNTSFSIDPSQPVNVLLYGEGNDGEMTIPIIRGEILRYEYAERLWGSDESFPLFGRMRIGEGGEIVRI